MHKTRLRNIIFIQLCFHTQRVIKQPSGKAKKLHSAKKENQ